jgi:hypothetical protein
MLAAFRQALGRWLTEPKFAQARFSPEEMNQGQGSPTLTATVLSCVVLCCGTANGWPMASPISFPSSIELRWDQSVVPITLAN